MTCAHLKWLRSTHLDNPILQEALSEYPATYQQSADKGSIIKPHGFSNHKPLHLMAGTGRVSVGPAGSAP